jgi:hypothetical protein
MIAALLLVKFLVATCAVRLHLRPPMENSRPSPVGQRTHRIQCRCFVFVFRLLLGRLPVLYLFTPFVLLQHHVSFGHPN